VTGGVKIFVLSPGRSVGRFAWVPARYVPYLGAGAGLMYYRFRQTGDFIDFDSLGVFPDTFVSRGWEPAYHAYGGLEMTLAPRVVLSTEAR
jgi:hypothetical protein